MTTPWPWSADDGDSPLWGVFDPDGNAIAYMARRGDAFAAGGNVEGLAAALAEDRANAHLMAAAPQMYEALLGVLKFFANDSGEFIVVRDAIAKAEAR